MAEFNVPDDWGMYYRTCENCGGRYHLSEGGCSCYEEEEERAQEELLERLRNCEIEEIGREVNKFDVTDDWTQMRIKAGETEVRLYITEPDGCDEIVLSEQSFAELSKLLDLGKEPTE